MEILSASVPLVDGAAATELPFVVFYYENGRFFYLGFATFGAAKEFANMRLAEHGEELVPPAICFAPVMWRPKATYEF